MISMYCSYLAQMLTRRRQSELEQVPRWPMGKKYAIVLSHDVDKPFTRPPWAFYLRRLRTNLSDTAPRAAVYGLAQMAKVATGNRYGQADRSR